jgi:hypothetical protein
MMTMKTMREPSRHLSRSRSSEMEETNQPERGSEDIYGAFALRTIMADTMAGRMHTGDGQKYLILFSILAGAVYEA